MVFGFLLQAFGALVARRYRLEGGELHLEG